MKLKAAVAALCLVAASCGGASSASTCVEYAAEVRELIDSEASPEEIEAFVDATDERVARMIMDDPDRAEPCVEAVFEAVFTAQLSGFEFTYDE